MAAGVAACCAATAARAAEPGEASTGLRVMSFNLKQQNPARDKAVDGIHHWTRRREIVFEVIRTAAPDVLAVQEAYRGQLDDLVAALPEFAEVGEGRDGGNRGEYCSILYRSDRFHVAGSGTFWLSDTPEVKSRSWGHFYFRICTWVRLVEKASGSALYVFNTHLDHQSQEAREKSVRLIARRIDARQHPDPFILAGDFNAGEDDPVIAYLKGKLEEPSPAPVVDSFRVVHPDQEHVGTGNRFTGEVDGIKADYIFVMPGTPVLEAAIIRSHRDGRYPSDHFPVTARIRLPSEDGGPGD